jgi:hypothetical protein
MLVVRLEGETTEFQPEQKAALVDGIDFVREAGKLLKKTHIGGTKQRDPLGPIAPKIAKAGPRRDVDGVNRPKLPLGAARASCPRPGVENTIIPDPRRALPKKPKG